MPVNRSTDQALSAEKSARLHAEADEALAKAEYEFYAMRFELQAALDVPLRDRAITVSAPAADADAHAPATNVSAKSKSAERLSLVARLAAAAAA